MGGREHLQETSTLLGGSLAHNILFPVQKPPLINQPQLPPKRKTYCLLFIYSSLYYIILASLQYLLYVFFCFASIKYLHLLIFLILTTTSQLPHPAHQSF